MGAGRGQSGRGALAALALIGVWVAVYWLWPTGSDGPAPITFDNLRAIANLDADAPQSPTDAPPRAAQDGAPAEQAADQPPVAPTPAPALMPPQFTQHVVQARETMQTIAERVYGDETLWSAIAQANPLTDPAKLRAGDTLRIPIDPTNIQGLPAPKKPSAPEPPRFPLEHVVKESETLSDIAKKFYGRGSLFGRIFDANRALLSSPDEIKPGMRLLIPPPPGGSE